MNPKINAPLLCLCALLPSSLLNAQWSSQQDARIYPSPNDLEIASEFGNAIALSGTTLIAGSQWHDPFGTGDAYGAAYLFVASGSGWAQQAKLASSSYDPDEHFGRSVAIEGDTAIVGAPGDANPGAPASGAVYVFERQGTIWTEVARLVASDASTFDSFGSAVAIDGDTLAIGAQYDNSGGGTFAGSAYVFVRSGSNWSQQAKLVAAGSASNELMGACIDVDGDRIAVGAPQRDSGGKVNSGAVFTFERSGTAWTQTAELFSSDVDAADQFGYALALDADTLLVGAPYDDGAGSNAGAAYVFTHSGGAWSSPVKLTDFAQVYADKFGTSVDLEGDRAVIGLPVSFIPGVATGAVQLFVRNAGVWSGEVEMVGSDCEGGDYLGSAVAIDGDLIVAGAKAGETPPTDLPTGEAYVFRLVPPPPVLSYCSAKQNSQGCTPAMGWSGVPSASNPNPFLLSCANVINFKSGLLFYGLAPAATPFQGGTLCIAAPIQRTAVQNSMGSFPPLADCTGNYSMDMNARIQSGLDPGLVAGAWAFAQYWSRDPAASFGTGLSDALQFQIAP